MELKPIPTFDTIPVQYLVVVGVYQLSQPERGNLWFSSQDYAQVLGLKTSAHLLLPFLRPWTSEPV